MRNREPKYGTRPVFWDPRIENVKGRRRFTDHVGFLEPEGDLWRAYEVVNVSFFNAPKEPVPDLAHCWELIESSRIALDLWREVPEGTPGATRALKFRNSGIGFHPDIGGPTEGFSKTTWIVKVP